MLYYLLYPWITPEKRMQSTVKEHDNLELQQSLQATEVFLSLILPLDVEYPSLKPSHNHER